MTFVAQHDLNCDASWGGECSCHQSMHTGMIDPYENVREALNAMLKYLPRHTIIAKTPDRAASTFTYEQVEVQTLDLINSFIALQGRAMKEIMEKERGAKRDKAVEAIKRMVYFKESR